MMMIHNKDVERRQCKNLQFQRGYLVCYNDYNHSVNMNFPLFIVRVIKSKTLRWRVHTKSIREIRKYLMEKKPPGIQEYRYEDNIKMDVREAVSEEQTKMRLWIFKLWTLLENFMHQVMYLMCK